jgi:acetyl-CoA acyltransferase 2
MASSVRNIFIVAAKRTAIGKYGGTLKDISPTDLCVTSTKAALAAASLNPELVDSVIVGNVIQSSPDAIYSARHVGLKSGVPIEREMYNVNRLCGSGFQSVINAVQSISIGEASIVIAAGTENMSMAPHAAWGLRFGAKLGSDIKLTDTLWNGLTDSYTGLPMAITAENLAEKYHISRDECDAFGLLSQQRWKSALDAGIFDAELCPVPVKTRKGVVDFTADEHPRVDVDLSSLSRLPAIFKKNGTVTAGTASGVNDGAGTIILASEEAVKKNGLTPLARIVGYGISGCDPSIMGIGPVSAIRKALAATSLNVSDMELVEVNEAFAAQYLAVEKELKLERERSNVCGGAIAIGHPLAASGSRILAHLTHRIAANNHKYVVGSACIGGGQGIAVILGSV